MTREMPIEMVRFWFDKNMESLGLDDVIKGKDLTREQMNAILAAAYEDDEEEL